MDKVYAIISHGFHLFSLSHTAWSGENLLILLGVFLFVTVGCDEELGYNGLKFQKWFWNKFYVFLKNFRIELNKFKKYYLKTLGSNPDKD